MSTMVIVHAYGCGAPISGLDHALAEHERCTQLWDTLVQIDRTIEASILQAARLDVPELMQVADSIDALTSRIASGHKTARDERRACYHRQNELLKIWRREHREVVREAEKRRQASVTLARQQTEAWWGNYLRVLEQYETGRAVARQKGRRLHLHDESRDDGLLSMRIQRPGGVGATPPELVNGRVSALQISPLNARGRAICEMQVDRDGHMLRLPVWIHRPIPTDGRIKAAKVTWNRQGGKMTWTLIVTLEVPRVALAPYSQVYPVELLWRADHDELTVMRVGERHWRLSRAWMHRLDHVAWMRERLDEALNEARQRFGSDPVAGRLLALKDNECMERLLLARPNLPCEVASWLSDRTIRRGRFEYSPFTLWRDWPRALRNTLRDRQNTYRHWCREIARSYPAIQLPVLNLAEIATAEKGEARNSLRHRAAPHLLRTELLHQCTKFGTAVVDASGKVINAPRDGKSNSWNRRKQNASRKLEAAA